MAFKLACDQTGERLYETGVDRGVLYPINEENKYTPGVAWNGLTGVTESPSGAEATDLYADNIKYLSMRSAETVIGNDTNGNDHGYLLHLIYGCTASPSEKAYATINDSPEAITFSWEVTTTPVNVEGFKATASLTIDSTKANATDLATLEGILYGTPAGDEGTPAAVEPRLPLPDEVAEIMSTTVAAG